MAVYYYYEGVKKPYFFYKRGVSLWLDRLAALHGHIIKDLNIIFVSDEELLVINRQFLNHDYYTDIDRVIDNAKKEGENILDEFIRVVAHGVLHLIGYQDKKRKDIIEMRACENEAISLYLRLIKGK
jgi:ssRNA-specific RNase YbeY (16S rRNA maturation enzyme)